MIGFILDKYECALKKFCLLLRTKKSDTNCFGQFSEDDGRRSLKLMTLHIPSEYISNDHQT